MTVGPFTVLTTGGSDTDAIDYSTASITPTAGKTIVAAISVLDLGSAKAAPTISGCNLTWSVLRATGGGATEPTLRTYTAPAIAPATGAITWAGVVTSGNTADGAIWAVFEIANTDLGTTDGLKYHVEQSVATDTVALTMGAFRDVFSGTCAFIAGYDNGGGAVSATEPTGFTELFDTSQAAGGDTIHLSFAYLTSNDGSIDGSVSAANDRLLTQGIEVYHAPRSQREFRQSFSRPPRPRGHPAGRVLGV